MKIFKISRRDRVSYDEYEAAVVIAEDEEAARLTHPRGGVVFDADKGGWVGEDSYDDPNRYWTAPDNVQVEYIGEAKEGSVACVVVADFWEA